MFVHADPSGTIFGRARNHRRRGPRPRVHFGRLTTACVSSLKRLGCLQRLAHAAGHWYFFRRPTTSIDTAHIGKPRFKNSEKNSSETQLPFVSVATRVCRPSRRHLHSNMLVLIISFWWSTGEVSLFTIPRERSANSETVYFQQLILVNRLAFSISAYLENGANSTVPTHHKNLWTYERVDEMTCRRGAAGRGKGRFDVWTCLSCGDVDGRVDVLGCFVVQVELGYSNAALGRSAAQSSEVSY